MKKILSVASLLLLLVACNMELQPVDPESQPQPRTAAGLVFHASFENQIVPGTKVFMNDAWKLCWNAGDEISLFNGTADNLKFGFTEEEGVRGGSFTPVNPSATMEGEPVPHIYAVYPYASGTTVSSDGTISLTLPAEQAYYGGVSFARGANTMVSVTENPSDNLVFKNVCGYMQLKLYGEGAPVTSVTLKGNGDELLAGPASVTAAPDGAPSVAMQSGATKKVSVVCATPVSLGSDAEHCTTFLLAIPPTTFSGGFTVTVTDSDGYVFEKKTTKNYTVARNAVFPMAPLNIRESEEPEIEEFEIENAGTRDYRINVDYSEDPSYTLSYVDTYKSTASDDPLPFTLSVNGATQVFIKSLSDTYPLEWTVSGSGSFAVYNLVPGVVYQYVARDSQGTNLKSGFVRPVGQIRMINGFSYNVRDLGGWKADGGTIAYGKLYRGAQLNGISDAAQKVILQDLGISVDLDLRGYNGSGTPSRVLDASLCEYENLQLWHFLGQGTGTTQELYQKAIRDIIGWLGEGRAIYFQCIGGADRTGTLAFLIEALLGVSESDLSKDYELTSFGGSSRHRNDNSSTFRYTWLINYLRSGDFGGYSVTINQNVENWAKTRFSEDVAPLTDNEIAQLRKYLVVTE